MNHLAFSVWGYCDMYMYVQIHKMYMYLLTNVELISLGVSPQCQLRRFNLKFGVLSISHQVKVVVVGWEGAVYLKCAGGTLYDSCGDSLLILTPSGPLHALFHCVYGYFLHDLVCIGTWNFPPNPHAHVHEKVRE